MKTSKIIGSAILIVASILTSCNKETSDPISVGDPGLAQSKTKYIVVFKESKSAGTLSQDFVKNEAVLSLNKLGADVLSISSVYNNVLEGFSADLTQEQADALKNDSKVAYIEKDQIVSVLGKVENIYNYKSSQTLAQTTPWGITYVGGYAVAGANTGVAWIVDTGVELTHPDLTVNSAKSRTFVKTGADATNLNDLNGHGTHVAGTIAAKNNTIGVVGVCAGATVISVKVLNSAGSGSISDIIDGLNYIGSNLVAGKLNVVNMSLGGSTSTALDNAVLSLASKGAKIVVAAGNSAANANYSSPARVNHANVFTISAFKNTGAFCSFSNYGNPPVDYSAPGESILSTYKGGQYATMSGTSMATPHVVGILLANNGAINWNGYVTGDKDSTPDKKAKR
eukprot:TRINITY_DN20250_c0_g1_i1.p1 TRINITY_DN20250_c0_g1~~TRINITY_DN20250_c0_g1_i1.p1  ORF type:complete len:397 (-),score=-64.47 TRINITY_DN20250_c0_g1_i1:46-1236(-)